MMCKRYLLMKSIAVSVASYGQPIGGAGCRAIRLARGRRASGSAQLTGPGTERPETVDVEATMVTPGGWAGAKFELGAGTREGAADPMQGIPTFRRWLATAAAACVGGVAADAQGWCGFVDGEDSAGASVSVVDIGSSSVGGGGSAYVGPLDGPGLRGNLRFRRLVWPRTALGRSDGQVPMR